MATYFKPGDRVKLAEPIGVLKAGAIGVVVEDYTLDDAWHDEVIGSRDNTFDYGSFDYAVAFPVLRTWMPAAAAGWVQKDVNLTQFHAGDVIPCRRDELLYIDSLIGGN